MTDFKFDEVHSISDIHLGGLPGFQIFNSGEALAALIAELQNRPPDVKVALVLNGDVVDFLAESPAKYFDAQQAQQKLARIFDDPAFKPVWDGLASFVSTENRYLVLVLGNHDVELALPAIQNQLRERLCGCDSAVNSRLHFAMDGSGFACEVGHAKALFLHGNEVDTWNVIDYHALTQTKRALNRCTELPQWSPCAGTKMVIDVMNYLKKDYQWIDLLKPELEAVFPLVFALAKDRTIAMRLKSIPSIARNYTIDAIRRKMKFLSAEEQLALEEQAFQQALQGRFLAIDHAKADEAALDALFASTEQPTNPLYLLDENNPDEQFLGWFGAIWDRILGRSAEHNVREALQDKLAKDRSFDPGYRDDTAEQIDQLVGADVSFVVAGHTHLHRALKRSVGNGYYFNSGTWIRLIQLTEELLKEENFKAVWQVLENGQMKYLDDPKRMDASFDFTLIKNIRTVVSLETLDDGRVKGCLQTVEPNSTGGYACKLVAGTEKFS